MTKLDEVEALVQAFEFTYEEAFDIVYGSEFICDENETDDAL